MKRTDFIRKLINIFLWGFLAGLAILLGKNATTDNSCSTCPDYASCTDRRRCKIIKTDKEG